ncbi:MAG TPA: hypothetical protein VFC93_11990 [Chloroflexota bacterium]|nr:hypothetical protein [Chloroflexota bacterium]
MEIVASRQMFASGERVLLRPWWSDRALVGAEVLERYRGRVVYYRVRADGDDARLVPADRLVGLPRTGGEFREFPDCPDQPDGYK